MDWRKVALILLTAIFIISILYVYVVTYSISDKVNLIIGLITVYALGVVALFSFFEWWFKDKERKLKMIDDELNEVYFPMLDIIIDDFLKKKGCTLITTMQISKSDADELEGAIERLITKIEIKTNYKIDDRVMDMKARFFGSEPKTTFNLVNLFIDAIKGKIKELKTKRQKYV